MDSYGYYPYREPEEEEAPDKPKRRNARARYRLTTVGSEAIEGYRRLVSEAQAGAGGRDALEHVQTEWAAARSLQPTDALLLDELSARPQTILELSRSLDDCGVKRPAVESGIDRLTAASLIEATPATPR